MARKDSWTWFVLGVAQLLLGDALLDAGTSKVLAQLIQFTGGGTIALGLYFLIFLARHESQFTDAYSKAERMVLEKDPESGRKNLVPSPTSTATKAAWYAVPAVMTFIGLIALLVS
jgi:hypothetical protein